MGSVLYQFCSRACGCGLISETRVALIAFGYCYSVMALGRIHLKLVLNVCCCFGAAINDVFKVWCSITFWDCRGPMEFEPTFRRSNRDGEVSKGVSAGSDTPYILYLTESKEIAPSL